MTYVNKKGERQKYPISNALDSDNSEMAKRLKYTKEIFLNVPYIVDTLVLVLGALLAIVAQIGDLLVSVLKRAAGVKDTGTIFHSHGGVLDRVDSHFFAAWLAFFIFFYFQIDYFKITFQF